MTTKRKIVFALLLVGLMAFATACSTSYRIISVEDHPNGNVTLMKTLTTTHGVAGYGDSTKYNYWECQRTDQGLSCEKTCWNKNFQGQWPEDAPKGGVECANYGTMVSK